MAEPIASATDPRYNAAPPTTPDGEIVLYRMAGDCWQVAREQDDVEFLTALGRIERRRKRIEVLLVRASGTGAP